MGWEDDWMHIGTGEHIKTELITQQIKKHFYISETLLLRRGRINSEELDLSNLIESALELVGVENFEIWNLELNRAIRISKVGVMIKGKT